MFQVIDRPNGVVEVRIDRAESEHNVLDQGAVAALDAVIGRLSDPAITAVLLSSAKKTFVAGGDIREILAAATPAEARALVSRNRACLRRLETLGKPVVALIEGPALGGGLEMAMACTYRIAADHPKVSLGLPEVGLGLMPGAGGTQRLPYLVGTAAALKLALTGKPVPAAEALALGLVDALAPAGGLVEAALAALAQGRVPSVQPWDRAPFDGPRPDPETESGRAVLGAFLPLVTGRAAENDPAPAAIVAAMNAGLATDMDRALAIEEDHFARIASGPVAKAKIRTLFFGVNDARSMPMRPAGVPAYAVRRIGVIGAGQMGSGIAHAAARAGVEVALIDITDEAAARGMAAIAAALERDVAKGRTGADAAAALLGRIVPGTDYAALAGADLVVEAVSEVVALKHKVLARAAAAIRPGVPLASNTSTLPITGLAAATARPQDVIGLHFFAPVERMPFVEVIRGQETSDQTLARALDFLKALRKSVVVVGDGLGFFTSRVVAAYTGEALTLLAEGVDPAAVDAAALAAGMPLGPLAMADITSLTLLRDIFASICGDARRQGLQGMRAQEALERMVATFGRTGRAGGGGVYDYPAGRPQPWAGLAACFPPASDPPPAAVIEQRLMYAQALEAARLIEEGVVATPRDADVGSVLAWAFPAWTGGVASYIDGIGRAAFVAGAEALAARYGGRFLPPESLRAPVAEVAR